MQSLTATLLAAQKAMGDVLCKLVLSKSGESDKTYGVDTTNRILDLRHPEGEWSQTAQVVIDNRDGNLTALALEGWMGIVSYGYHTSAGDEYKAKSPLTVIAQKTDSMQGELVTTLSLAGLFNMWAEQKATEAYAPDEINTDTVKTIMDAIASHSMTCFGSYPVHTITYDSGYDDSIINAFKPADAFSVAKGESRLSAFKKALAYTKCKCRIENDSSVATIHIFQPVTTGATYDYEYNDAEGLTNHNFFDKSVRKRLVLPNKVTVMNHPDHSDSYTGSATDAASYAALGDQYYTETNYCRPSSNAQAALIATGILLKYQMAAEKGHGFAPMNCGQEVWDYVKITDSRASDTRVGNIGYISRHYTPGKFEMEFRFGTLELFGLAGTVPPAQTAITIREPSMQQSLIDQVSDLIDSYNSMIGNYNALRESLLETIATANSIIDYLINRQWEGEFAKLSVTLRFQGPTGTDMYS